MKSTEPNASNNSSNKVPPYPVEGSTLNNNTTMPDRHTTDVVTAIQYGFYERVIELIEADSQLTTKLLDDNITLLHWAAINNRIEIAKYLISKGAKIDAIGGALHSTPLYWAIRDGKLEMTVFLLSYGAQTSFFDDEGVAGIHIASMLGHSYIVAYLIAKGDDVNRLDKFGLTPLMHAQRVMNRDPTQILIRLGADINHQNPDNKYTALHYAVSYNNDDAIRVLIDAGAKTNIRNSDNEDIFDLAAKAKNARSLLRLLSGLTSSNKVVPRWLEVDRSTRLFGIKLLPYILIILVALIVDLEIWFVYKGVVFVGLFLLTRGYMMIFSDDKLHGKAPIAIAQASIFWLYACYLYNFLPYIHVMSFSFIGLLIFTYFSWKSYYLAIKVDPGYIVTNTDQLHRTIIQLAEQNMFDSEHFCTWCLVRRPLRSKHCRACQRCVAKFDHHCPWVDNCVGDKTLPYFTGFIFFTPICLLFFLYGAFVYYRNHCNITSIGLLSAIINCKASVLWFTGIAMLHTFWISALCITLVTQILAGFTTNERFNFWRYGYMRVDDGLSPFSFGWKQNLVDLLNRRILWYTPTNFDWTRIYTLDDFNELIPTRLRRSTKSSLNNLPKHSFNV
ncbi:unnamed protein product [Rotaria magnacalcarata]|uniref:Palmitoyltransferase n=6 Tax=Rotaria magnacalcarata TaxID=392030 RepID=A0A816NP47_9BILA|nr:unnamed protein product [Rotaria magnacalcarata]CAF3774476.1 unnamed protein product [Rotaria magnacalcarata]